MTVKVAVIYYSATGTVHALAEALAEGAAVAGAEVRLRRVAELVSDSAIDQNPLWRQHTDATAAITEATVDDLAWADAFAFGTPTRFGTPAAQLKQFIDQAVTLWRDGGLADKPVTAFTSAYHRHGGNEATILSLSNVFYHWGWASTRVVVMAAVGLLLLCVFVMVETRFAARPMTPPRLFRLRGVAVGNGMLLLFGGISIAMWYFTSLFLQNVLGYTALQAGLGQTPAAVAFVVVARLATGLPFGARRLVLAGCACLVTGFGWLAIADADYVTGVLAPTLVIAAGIGLTFPTLMSAATADPPPGDAGTVGGLATTANQVGGSVGLAILATTTGYHLVFLIAAGLGIAIAAISALLPRHPDLHTAA